jgi:murein DD-endopeptidase MepM/ murein hydrolase activator NlpD
MARGTRRIALLGGVFVAGVVVVSLAWSGERLPVAAPIVVTRAYVEQADTVRAGETLSDLFARQQVVGADLLAVLDALEGLNPRRIRPKTIFEFRYPFGEDRPDRVRVRVSDEAFLRADREGDGWTGTRERVDWAIERERVTGAVQSSLYETLDALIPDSVLPTLGRSQLAWDLADEVFPWQIDFTRDIHPGDGFVVVYERLMSSLGEVRYGRVLAADIETAGQENTAYVLSDGEGRNAYYDAQGRSLRRAFKMYPVKFRRISSGFSRGRFHPVLRTTRAHLGTDYAADTGTPIEATGDGTVIRAGRWGGYGIMVALRHPKGIETRYAHMSRLASGIRPGVRVRQGQIIGFVGMTGLANGPHVHYEFLKNGRHLNPRRVDLGNGEPVPARLRAQFDSVRAAYDHLLGRSPAAETGAKID